jgi:hypothetical protein
MLDRIALTPAYFARTGSDVYILPGGGVGSDDSIVLCSVKDDRTTVAKGVTDRLSPLLGIPGIGTEASNALIGGRVPNVKEPLRNDVPNGASVATGAILLAHPVIATR